MTDVRSREALLVDLTEVPAGRLLDWKPANRKAEDLVNEVRLYLLAEKEAGRPLLDPEFATGILTHQLEPLVRRDTGSRSIECLAIMAEEGPEAAEMLNALLLEHLHAVTPSGDATRMLQGCFSSLNRRRGSQLGQAAVRAGVLQWVALAEHYAGWEHFDGTYDSTATLVAVTANFALRLASEQEVFGEVAKRGLAACLVHLQPGGCNRSRRPIPDSFFAEDVIQAADWAEAIGVLVRRSLDALNPEDVARFEEQGASFGNMPAFVWVGQALNALRMLASEEAISAIVEQNLSDADADWFSRMLMFWAEGHYGNPMRPQPMSMFGGKWVAGRPTAVEEVVRRLLTSRDPLPRYLAQAAFYFGLIDEAQVSPEDRLTLPEELPTKWSDALKLIGALGVSETYLNRGEPADVPAVMGAFRTAGLETNPVDVLMVYRTYDGVGRLQPVSEWGRLASEFESTVVCHQEDVGDPPLGKLGRDVRHHDKPGRCLALGQTNTGDIFFVDPEVDVVETGTMPVMKYHHDQAFGCRVEALSVGHFVALEVARAFLRERNRSGEITAYTGFEATLRVKE